MNVIAVNMLTNTIKTAEYKLSMHRKMGNKSKLNIFQVAELIDSVIKAKEIQNNKTTQSIFFGFSVN